MNIFIENIRRDREPFLHILRSCFKEKKPQVQLTLHVVEGVSIKEFSYAFRKLVKNRSFGTYFYCYEKSIGGHLDLHLVTTSDFNHDWIGLKKSWFFALSQVLKKDQMVQCSEDQNMHIQLISEDSWVSAILYMLKCDDFVHYIVTQGVHKFGSSMDINKKIQGVRSFVGLIFASDLVSGVCKEEASGDVVPIIEREEKDNVLKISSIAENYDFDSLLEQVITEYRNDSNMHISNDLIRDQLIMELACYNENLYYFNFNNFVRFIGTQRSRIGRYFMDLHLLFKKILTSEEYQIISCFKSEVLKAQRSVINSNTVWKSLILSFLSKYYNSQDTNIVFLLSNCLFLIFRSENKDVLRLLQQLGNFLIRSFNLAEYETIMKSSFPNPLETKTKSVVQLGHILYVLVKESVFRNTHTVMRIREEHSTVFHEDDENDIYSMDEGRDESTQKKIHFEFDLDKLALLSPQFSRNRLYHIQLHTKMKKPCMVPPKMWKTGECPAKIQNNMLFFDANSNYTGGLLLNGILLYRSLCKKPKQADHRLLLSLKSFESVNQTQSIAYRLDRDLLQFYITNKVKLAGWLTAPKLLDLRNTYEQSRVRLRCMYKEKAELMKLATSNMSLILKNISRENLVQDDLQERISNHFVLKRLIEGFASIDYEPFYFSQEYDFRMRLYPSPHELTYAAHKFSRSLIRFDVYRHINLDEFKMYSVSQYIETRDKTEDAKIMIFETDVRPLLENYQKSDIIEKINLHAKEPFMFYACAAEWCRFIRAGADPYTYLSNFPVYWDCTAQGPQIMSVFFALDQFKKYLNLCAQDKEGVRGDYYSAVIIQYLLKMRSPVLLSPSEYQNRTDLGVVVRFEFEPKREIIDWFRKHLKSAILPLIYGETKRKFGNSVFKMCHSGGALDILNQVFYISNFGKFVSDLSNNFWSFTQELPIFVMKPLLKSYKESMELGSDGSVEWSVFDSNIIKQKYLKVQRHRLQSRVREHRYQFVVYDVMDEVLRSKQISSLLANFTHSLDAWILGQLYTHCGFPIMSIHDSYGIHSGNIEILRNQVRALLLYLHSHGFNFFTEQWADYIEKSAGSEAKNKFLEVVAESRRSCGNLSVEDLSSAYHFISY